jgi:glycosyltransferase involved in cell wall biosynthesis
VAAAFDTTTEAGCSAYFEWFVEHGRAELARYTLFAASPPPPIPASGNVHVGPTAPLIVLTGCISEPTGRSEDVRMTMRALNSQRVPYVTLDRKDGLVRDVQGSVIDPAVVASASVNIVHLNADTAFDDYQFLRRYGIGNAKLIGYWAWELATLPAQYFRAFSFYDEIWASTKFAFDAFDIGYRPVTLMPMPVEVPGKLAAMDRSHYRLPESRFLFLFNFDFGSYRARKNPEAVIAAFRQAFPDRRERVGLIVKTINAENHQEEWEALQQLAHDDQRIIMRNGRYTREEMLNLISVCDCYVSLHRSEGFGRGPAEAMLQGRPVIVTNYSGNVDFTKDDNSFLVDYRLMPVGGDEYPGGDGQVWADPDIGHSALQMRRVFENPALARRIGGRARRFMETRHAPAAIGKIYLKRLCELEPGLVTHQELARPRASARRSHPITGTSAALVDLPAS